MITNISFVRSSGCSRRSFLPPKQRYDSYLVFSFLEVEGFCHAEHLRISCDLMNFYFAFDEYTDLANEEEAMQIARDVMYAFKHTDKPFDNKMNEMSRQ